MIKCKCVIYQGNEFCVRPLGLQGKIMQTIDQTKAIQAMQLAIRSEQSKQYGLRYDQDKLGGGYIVSSTYAKTRDPSDKLDIQEVGVKR